MSRQQKHAKKLAVIRISKELFAVIKERVKKINTTLPNGAKTTIKSYVEEKLK